MAYLNIGDSAPDFTANDQNGKEIKLENFRGKKVILYFYPKDNTPGCTAESCNFRDHYADLTQRGFVVIGVSPDNEASHTRFVTKYDLPFILLADTEKVILKSYGAWGLKKNYGREYEGVIRTTYIIDEEGKIEQVIKKVKTKEATEQILDLMA